MFHDEREIQERQATVLRAMSVEQRLALVDGLRQSAWDVKRAMIVSLHPDWAADQVEAAVRDAFAHAGS